MYEQDTLGLIIFFQLSSEVVGVHQVKLLADLAFKSVSEVNIASNYFLKREHLVAGEDFILQLADKEFRIQVRKTLLGCIN